MNRSWCTGTFSSQPKTTFVLLTLFHWQTLFLLVGSLYVVWAHKSLHVTQPKHACLRQGKSVWLWFASRRQRTCPKIWRTASSSNISCFAKDNRYATGYSPACQPARKGELRECRQTDLTSEHQSPSPKWPGPAGSIQPY